MEKIIAGELVKTENLVVTASVAVAKVDGSGEASMSVYLNMKNYAAEEIPAIPYSYAEIKEAVEAAGGEMVLEGIEIAEPVAVRYAKTKAFEVEAGIVVQAALRYTC